MAKALAAGFQFRFETLGEALESILCRQPKRAEKRTEVAEPGPLRQAVKPAVE